MESCPERELTRHWIVTLGPMAATPVIRVPDLGDRQGAGSRMTAPK